MAQFKVKYEFRFNPESRKKTDNNIENFYSHHRMKIYDNTVEEEWTESEDAKKYSFDISKELLKEYKSQIDIFRYLKRLEENKSIYSVTIQPNRSLRFRNDEIGVFFREKKAEYKKNYNYEDSLAERFAKTDVEEEYLSDVGIAKYGKINPQYNYYITIFSRGLSGLLQQLFISTLVFAECGEKWPKGIDRESFVFQFDTELKQATLVEINIYNLDNPFNKYMRKSMRIVRRYTSQETKSNDVIDYYIDNKITQWDKYDKKEFEEQMKREDNTLGVYMLYDSVKGYFYVGKAEQVYSRMQQHRDSNELIKEFDYYRYSLVDPIYYEDIFLIENAAIHDCAMIFNMIGNKDYGEKALSLMLPDGKDIKDVIMVNSVKKQSKRPNKR